MKEKIIDLGIAKIKLKEVEEKKPELGEVVVFGGAGVNEKGEPRTYPLNFGVGDTIAYRKFGESSFYIGGELMKFVSFDDVLAVIKEKK